MTERGRFAPTPSGALHLGSARTALASMLAARRDGGRFVLRVEDLDPVRTTEGATAAMLSDLAWLGVTWDEGPDVGGPHAPYVQSERHGLYAEALAMLRARGAVYPCACSRRDIELASQAPHGREPIYPGTCRARDPDQVLHEAHERRRAVSWRLRVPEDAVARFDDAVTGPHEEHIAREVGDFVVFRADGVAAYQLAVVVDDVAMEITEVVRGDDLLASTGRQLLLYQLFGAAPPRYAHLPLVTGDDGVRLAKRHGSVSIASLRAAGVEPERARRALLASLGVHGDPARTALDFRAIPRGALALSSLRGALPEIG